MTCNDTDYGYETVTSQYIFREYFVTIGARLKEERDRLKLSQTALAEAAGTTKKTQIDYEKDNTQPKAQYLAKAAALGVDVAYVITGVRLENVASTPAELAFLRNCRAFKTNAARTSALNALAALSGLADEGKSQ